MMLLIKEELHQYKNRIRKTVVCINEILLLLVGRTYFFVLVDLFLCVFSCFCLFLRQKTG